jgi:osmoprotectant transport system ATP-binding protein
MCSATQRILARKLGYVIQDGGLFPHLSAQNNITLVATTLGWGKKELQTRLQELLSLVSLGQAILGKFPHELSGGQKQRVGLMRALFLDPPLMLLDEPLGALDPINRSDLQNELKKIFNDLKKTVILVTHDMAEAAFLGDSITLFKKGHIVQHGRFEDLLESPASRYVTQFVNAQKTLSALEVES